MPMISVVLPTYNRAALLREAIASVRAQTFTDWELLVIDDGSTDDSAAVIREAARTDRRIRALRGPHRGVSAARNLGIEHAQGAYVAFLDDDDFWTPEHAARQLAQLSAHPEWAFVYTQAELRYEYGSTKLRHPLATTFEMLLEKNTIAVPAVLARRTILLEMGGFPVVMRVSEDVNLWLRISARYPFGVIEEPLTVCRQSLARNDARYREAIENHLHTLAQLARTVTTASRRHLVRQHTAKERYKLARFYREQGRAWDAACELTRAVGTDPSVGLVWRKNGEGSALMYWIKPYLGIVACGLRSVGSTPASRTTTSGPRTILYVETGTGFGGSAQNLQTRLLGLDQARFRPIVVAYHAGGAIQQIQQLGVPVHIMPPVVPKVGGYAWLIRKWLTVELPRTRRLITLIRRERVDLVHTNNDLYSSAAPIWAAKWCRRPVVCHLQLTRTPTQLERRMGGWADRLVAVTRHAHALYQQAWPSRTIGVIYDAVHVNGATTDGLSSLRQDLGIPADAPVVGLMARCVPGKGYEEFLRAAAIVRPHAPAARFLIVGHGVGGDAAHEAAMRKLAHQLGLQSCVVWGGWRSDTARVLHLLSVVVQASSTFPEGLSRVLLEAMTYGRPVVATGLPTTREAVLDGDTGLLAEPGNPQSLADAILRVLRDPALADRLGRQGRAHVAERFSVAAHAGQVMGLYDELLKAA